jgi:hypothetical protein
VLQYSRQCKSPLSTDQQRRSFALPTDLFRLLWCPPRTCVWRTARHTALDRFHPFQEGRVRLNHRCASTIGRVAEAAQTVEKRAHPIERSDYATAFLHRVRRIDSGGGSLVEQLSKQFSNLRNLCRPTNQELVISIARSVLCLFEDAAHRNC